MTPQWKATLREDSDGNTIVGFSLEGEHGDIQMDAGKVDPRDLDNKQLDRLRRRAIGVPLPDRVPRAEYNAAQSYTGAGDEGALHQAKFSPSPK